MEFAFPMSMHVEPAVLRMTEPDVSSVGEKYQKMRGREVSEDTPYDVCVFKSGKIYNCDLSASYNIGARYFIRGVFMESPNLMTKVSGIGSGTQRTLADLWKINRVLYPLLPATV